MKKVLICALVALMLFSFVGCVEFIEGIPEEEYDELKQKYDVLKEEYDELKQKYDALKEEYDAVVLEGDALLRGDTDSKADNKYLTKTEWAMYDRSYMFAVEVDGFDGDVFQAGTYSFVLEGGITKSATENGGIAKFPMVFDVYIADKEYSSLTEMHQDFNIPTLTIGGISSSTYEYTLNKGQYVYVVPYQDLVYEPSGYLTIKLK